MLNIQDLPPELLTRIFFFIAPPRGPISPDVIEELKAREARELSNNAKASANTTADGDDASKPSQDHGIDDSDWEDDMDDKNGKVYSRPHKDLRNICLVSRLFRDLAQPFLFYSFEETGLAGPLVQTVSFARALYTRPELGEYVRELDIMYPLDDEKPKPLSAEDAKFFGAAIKSLQLGDQEKTWISGLVNRVDLSILTALLINKTPHLRELFLPGDSIRMGPLSHLLSLKPTLLSELQSFSFEGEDEFLGIDIATHYQIFTLPKLKDVNLTFANLLDKTFPASWAPGTLAVEKVVFRRCHMDVGGLRRFVQACKNLKSFTYNSFLSGMPRPCRKPEFDASQAYEAILPHKDTLEHFELVFAGSILEMESLGGHLTDLGKLGSFRDFPVLESLSIGHNLLPLHPQFPPSLKKLYIEDCISSIRDMVGLIADDCKKGLYPNLTVFKVFSTDITEAIKLPGQIIPAGKTPEQCFSSLRDLFNGTKVDFMIAPYQVWDLDDLMDYDDYEDDDDMDFDDELDLDPYEYQLGEGFGPPTGTIFDNLARALGYNGPDYDSDRSWETEEDN